MHIVVKGEFELLRSKKTKYHLMDPLKQDRITYGKYMDDSQMYKLLECRNKKSNGHKIRRSIDLDQKSFNDTLYQGQRG